MRLLVLDTNVIVSAGIKADSAPGRIVMDWVLEGRIQVVVSPWLTDEYREVVRRKKFRVYGFPPLWLEFLIEESMRLADPPPWPLPGPDPKDLPLLALANQAGAWLITGKVKHFPESVRAGVKVVAPADLLKHLTAGSPL